MPSVSLNWALLVAIIGYGARDLCVYVTLVEASCFVDEVCTRENNGFLNCIQQSMCAMLHQPNADYYPSMQIRQVVKVEKDMNRQTSTVSTLNLA